MKSFRTFVAAMMALAMSLSLAACGGAQTAAPVTNAQPAISDTESVEDSVAEETEEPVEEYSLISVEAPNGTYVGHENDGIAEFRGIRYGEFTPWMPAKDVTTTTADVIEAHEFGANCIQPYDEVEIASHGPNAHDCLFLNLWTKDVNTADKPVIVFIHGGSCIWGGTSDPTYDGQSFVRELAENEDCVFVTINYRMSVMGGLDLSVLEGYTDEYADAMNLSKRDQTQALKWINENIAAWGGDPDNVTIMGQSAGGGAVEMLMADPDTHQYFNRAIVNSGAQNREALGVEKFTENSRTVCEIFGVTTVEELVALSDEEISSHMDEIRETLGVAHAGLKCADGLVISETWWEDLVNGAAADIDLLIGGTNGEEDWDAIDWDNSVSEPLQDNGDIIDGIIERDTERSGGYGRLYASSVDGFIDGYIALGDDPVKQAMDLHNDVFFNYPTYLFACMQSENNANTWYYNWEYAPDMNEVLDYNGDSAEVSPWGRALHCMDLIFELGTRDGYVEMSGNPETINETMIAQAREMVYHFALCGNPNNDLIPEWKPFNTEECASMLIGADGTWETTYNYRADIWDYMSQLSLYGVN